MNQLTRRSAMQALGAAMLGGLLWPRELGAAPLATPQDPIAPFDFDKAAIGKIDLGDGITVLQGPGGNITHVAGDGGSGLLIDCGVPGRGGDVAKAVQSIGGKLPSTTLIDTHWHFDHAGGNDELHQAGVATIVAHPNTLKRLSATQHMEAFGMDVAPAPEASRPTLTADALHLRLNGGQAVAATYAPNAHTDGDLFLHIERGDVLVTGDLFFNGLYPFIDASSNGSIDGMIAAANQLLAVVNDKTRIVPGHGPVGGKADLTASRDMLQTVRDRLAQLAAKGLTIEQAVDAKPLANLDAAWGQRMFHSSHFVRLVYPMVKP